MSSQRRVAWGGLIAHGLLGASWALGVLTRSAPERLGLGSADAYVSCYEIRLSAVVHAGDTLSVRWVDVPVNPAEGAGSLLRTENRGGQSARGSRDERHRHNLRGLNGSRRVSAPGFSSANDHRCTRLEVATRRVLRRGHLRDGSAGAKRWVERFQSPTLFPSQVGSVS